jgi:hypothetical protein
VGRNMQYVDSGLVLKLIQDFFNTYNEIDKLKKGNVDIFDSKYQKHIEDCIKKYCLLMGELSPEKITRIPQKEKENVKKIYSLIREFGEDGDSVENLLMTAYDWHSHENAIGAAKLQFLFDFPYFSPDNWLNEYFKINPLILSLNSNLPKEIERRLFEATHCYIYGFYNACTALCRSILESALKEKLKGKIPNYWTLEEIIKWVQKTSSNDNQSTWNIDKIRRKANKVLHNLQENINKKSCYNTIIDTRKILEEFF